MFREIITPSEKNHSIELPQEFFGKKIEVFAFELKDKTKRRKKTSKKAISQLAGAFPDFPSVEEIRKKAWPVRW